MLRPPYFDTYPNVVQTHGQSPSTNPCPNSQVRDYQAQATSVFYHRTNHPMNLCEALTKVTLVTATRSEVSCPGEMEQDPI